MHYFVHIIFVCYGSLCLSVFARCISWFFMLLLLLLRLCVCDGRVFFLNFSYMLLLLRELHFCFFFSFFVFILYVNLVFVSLFLFRFFPIDVGNYTDRCFSIYLIAYEKWARTSLFGKWNHNQINKRCVTSVCVHHLCVSITVAKKSERDWELTLASIIHTRKI